MKLNQLVNKTSGQKAPVIKILFIDSDPVAHRRLASKMSESLSQILGRPVKILSCLSGKDAWMTLKKQNVDLVILDGDCPLGSYGSEALHDKLQKQFKKLPQVLIQKQSTYTTACDFSAQFQFPLRAHDFKQLARVLKKQPAA